MATHLVASTTNLLNTRSKSDTTRLVLAVGSRAGREATLQHGYYMIGRHSECQIRPKSRSVSRRHCLLHLDDTGLKVFDLNSTSGTRVNELRLQSQAWTRLRQGDVLRCGKVVFRVELGQGNDDRSLAMPHLESVNGDKKEMPCGQAWHDVDIAGFLETADEVDRERRYEHIRSTQCQDSEHVEDSSDDLQTTIEMDLDLDLFEDAFDDPQSQQPVKDCVVESGPQAVSDAGRGNDATLGKSTSSRTKGKSSSGWQSHARKPVHRESTGRSAIGMLANADRWKVIGIVFLAIAALATAGTSAYWFYTGPNVRVLQNID